MRVEFTLIGEVALKINKNKEVIFIHKDGATVGDALAQLIKKHQTVINLDAFQAYQIYLARDGSPAANINSLQKMATALGKDNRILFLYPFGGG